MVNGQDCILRQNIKILFLSKIFEADQKKKHTAQKLSLDELFHIHTLIKMIKGAVV